MRFFLSFLTLLIGTSMGTAQDFDTSLKGRGLVYHEDVELTREQKRAVKRFQGRSTFYGALAVNVRDQSEAAAGAMWGVHDLTVAQDMAMRSCQSKTNTPSDCILLASIVPANQGRTQPKVTLSRSALKGMTEMLDRQSVVDRKYGAFAATRLWAWGWATNRDSEQEAKADAMANCQRNAASAGRNQSADWRKRVIDQNDNTCRVIHVTRP